MRALVISVFLVGCLASADALDASDVTRMNNLAGKVNQLRRDVLSARKSSPHVEAWECLNELYKELYSISMELGGLQSLVVIASSMIDKRDEQVVLTALRQDGSSFLKDLEFSREEINATAGRCSSINVAVAKAQEILSLYSEATSVVRPITQKTR
jgi:hypothetical protein